MKKLFLTTLAIATLLACSKEKTAEDSSFDGETVAVININVNGIASGSRAVEDGHDGADGDKLLPKVFSVTVIPYNEYGVEISQIDLNSDQVKKAVWGSGKDADGNTLSMNKPTTGAIVGLPTGTKKVDVIVNHPSGVNSEKVTNINYFNYRSDQADKGDNTPGTTSNYERVYLVSSYYGTGTDLGNSSGDVNGMPSYTLEFSVSPIYARLEVHGGINVKEAETWVDGYGSNWRTMAKTDFDVKYPSLTFNTKTGEYTQKKNVAIVGGGMQEVEVTFRNAVAGTTENGFNTDLVYFPEYYWYDVTGVSSRAPLDKSKVLTETDVEDDPNTGAAWIKNNDFGSAGEPVSWLPNMFYAVDVESVFINNIKVRGANYTPYTHPWPGSEAMTGWVDWYKAYHMGGWHTAGSSSGNTFLCMGNMWDRIATTNDPTKDEMTIQYPSLTTSGGKDEMGVIIGKAIPLADKSGYYSTDRNLGIISGKAASYQIYPQATSTATDKEQIMSSLPHVILKVKAYENATNYAKGTYVKDKEFITIKAFQQAGSYVTSFKNATIYRINLNNLLSTFVGKVPVPGGKPSVNPTDPIDPDPEMPGSQLDVRVEIVPWTIQNIIPSI